MTLVPNDQTLRAMEQQQYTTFLLDQLTALSVAMQDVRTQQCQLSERQHALFTQQQALSQQQQGLFAEESLLRQKKKGIFALLSCLGERGESSPR